MNLKTACFLLGLFQAGSAAALGMGDINVHSQLGRPLRASVPLFGTTANTTADCFSLGASVDSFAPPLHATLSIERAGGQTRLLIRTLSALNDPIVQFVLISDCEVRLQREYVVLLDPPVATASVVDDVASAAAAQTQASPAPAAAPAHAVTHSRRSTHRPRRALASAARPSKAHSRKQAAPHAHAVSKKNTPRLVLSGKQDPSSQGDTPVALQRDTRLPDLTQTHLKKLTDTELSDENTALDRRLAYLEAQLAALQRRNNELEAARHATPAASTVPATPAQSVRWPLYLLVLAIVAGLTAWLLRRNRPAGNQPGAVAPWTQTWTPEKTLSELSADMPAESQSISRMPEIAAPQSTSGTEVKEDVLDQAEVFMAFGHGDLAIHLLQEHLRDAPTESPVPWLLLLDLLHREGNTAGYAAASAECRQYFNVNLTDHPISQNSEASHGLEAYPHLLEQLEKTWNTPEIGAFFHDLIYDNRGGTRIGFEPGAYRDILL
ncbi:type IV pilus assembly protein FimV, partial [Thiobacillus sp.]